MNKTTHSGYATEFAAVRDSLPGQGLPWLDALRVQAIKQFAEAGLPTIRDEVWKFTNLRALGRDLYALAPARENSIAIDDLASHLPSDLDCHRLVFVNGRLRADLSDTDALPDGVRLTSLAELLTHDPAAAEGYFSDSIDGDSPVALNTAFMTDGAVLTIDDGVTVERPVHLLYLAAPDEGPASVHTRNLIVAGTASNVTVIESYAAANPGVYWTNAVTDIHAARDANLHHIKLQGEATEAFHLAATRARLADGVAYHSFVAQIGARLARNEIVAILDGSNIDCRLGGTYLGRGKQHLDNTTVVDHAEPGSYSNEHYKGVLDGNAHGVFQGKIIVRPDAQKTDAHQLNRNLLLSESSQVDTKPELEIHADDVQCSHGATVGEIDDDALFYMRARGIDDHEARQMLVEAFVGEIIDTVSIEPIRDHLRQTVARWLAAAVIV